MINALTNIRNSFRKGSIPIQIIYINVAVFLIIAFIHLMVILFNRSIAEFLLLLELPASFMQLLRQPWSIITYMFMHAGILHLLFNMLWLYWFGTIFLYSYSSKHLRGLYILGGICGGLLYMISYHIFPYFAGALYTSYLIGASASVLAIVAATAYREPNFPVRLFLFGVIRLKYIALFVIITDLLFITSANVGGHIAHLGGALGGLAFAAGLNKGTDLTAWINKPLDWILSLFNKKTWKRKHKPNMKVHYNRRSKDYDFNARKKTQSDEVDRILDKLKKSGYDNLSSEEKKTLFDASKK